MVGITIEDVRAVCDDWLEGLFTESGFAELPFDEISPEVESLATQIMELIDTDTDEGEDDVEASLFDG